MPQCAQNCNLFGSWNLTNWGEENELAHILTEHWWQSIGFVRFEKVDFLFKYYKVLRLCFILTSWLWDYRLLFRSKWLMQAMSWYLYFIARIQCLFLQISCHRGQYFKPRFWAFLLSWFYDMTQYQTFSFFDIHRLLEYGYHFKSVCISFLHTMASIHNNLAKFRFILVCFKW